MSLYLFSYVSSENVFLCNESLTAIENELFTHMAIYSSVFAHMQMTKRREYGSKVAWDHSQLAIQYFGKCNSNESNKTNVQTSWESGWFPRPLSSTFQRIKIWHRVHVTFNSTPIFVGSVAS